MFAISSAGVEHELAYRRHELERAASRTAVVSHHVERDNAEPSERRSVWADLRRLIPRTL